MASGPDKRAQNLEQVRKETGNNQKCSEHISFFFYLLFEFMIMHLLLHQTSLTAFEVSSLYRRCCNYRCHSFIQQHVEQLYHDMSLRPHGFTPAMEQPLRVR